MIDESVLELMCFDLQSVSFYTGPHGTQNSSFAKRQSFPKDLRSKFIVDFIFKRR